MPVVKLNNQFLLSGLVCPPNKTKIEYVSDDRSGLYIEVRASNPGKGLYRIRYKDPAGKTCHHRLGTINELTLEQAREQTAEFKAGLKLGQYPEKASSASKQQDMTLSTFMIEHYLPFKKDRKRSFSDDVQIWNQRILPSPIASKPLTDIKRTDVEALQTAAITAGKAPATANHIVKLLRHALNLAVEWGYLNKNPLSGIKMIFENNLVENYMDDAQLKRLIAVLEKYDNRIPVLVFSLLLYVGIRLNEALTLTWKDIDIDNRLLKIKAQNSKSKKVRSVPLNDAAIRVLRKLDTQGKYDHLFINVKTGKPYVQIHKAWMKIRKEAGLSHLRIHDLRHQYASLLVNSGRTLYEVQQILGHSDPKVTMRYAHLSTKALQDAANSANEMINKAVNGK